MRAILIRPYYLLCACILLLYFAFLTRTYYWDGVLFSLDIEGVHQGHVPATALFHPNHLIYNAVGYAIYSVAVWLWPGIRALTVLQLVNVVASVFAGYVLFLIARRVTDARAVAFFCWLLFAAGATWWKFSTDADSYIVSVLLLLFCALFFLGQQPRIILAGLCHAAAMLFHELAIFMYVPVLAWILLDARKTLVRKLAIVVAYCAATGAIVTVAYWVCYWDTNHDVYPNLLSWATSYSSDKGFTSSLSDIVRHYLTSYLKLFAGGKLSLIRQFFGVTECAALLLCVALILGAIRLVRRPRIAEQTNVDRRALIFVWTWFIGYALFLGAWDPGSAFHKLFIWPAMVLLIGVYVVRSNYARQRVRAFTVFAAALAAWNFAAFIYPHSHVEADPVLVFAQKIDRELPKDALVLYRVFDPDDWYLEYFAPGRTWSPFVLIDSFPLSRPVCYETTALGEAQGPIDPNMKWELVNKAHNVRVGCLKNGP
jgi:hypothetical protein